MSAIPAAEVLAVRGRFVDIRCPYCGRPHTHGIERLGRTEHRSPGCGIGLPGHARLIGYRFTTERRDTP